MTKAKNDSNPFRDTSRGQQIPAVRELVGVSNTSITTDEWAPISVPAGLNCKAITVQTRNGESWLMGAEDSASEYITVDVPFSLDIAQGPTTVLFYAKAAVNDTLEVAFWD